MIEKLEAYRSNFQTTVSALDGLKTVFETGIKPHTGVIVERGNAVRDGINVAVEENARALEAAVARARSV